MTAGEYTFTSKGTINGIGISWESTNPIGDIILYVCNGFLNVDSHDS